MYSIIRLGLIIFLHHITVEVESCHDQSNPNNVDICSEETTTGRDITLYYTGSNDTTCSCTVTGRLIKLTPTGMLTRETTVRIIKPNGQEDSFNCNTSLEVFTHYFLEDNQTRTLNVIVRTEANMKPCPDFPSPDFCLHFISTNYNAPENITITCGSDTSPTSSTSTVTASRSFTTNISSSSVVPLTTETSTTTVKASSSITTNISASSTVPLTTETSMAITSTFVTQSDNQQDPMPQQEKIRTEVVVSAAGGGFLLVIILVIAIICFSFRKRKRCLELKTSDEKIERNYAIQPESYTNNTMQDENDDEMRINILYESSDDVQFDNLDGVSGGHSKVQRFSHGKPEYMDDNYSGIELSSQGNHRSSCKKHADVDLHGSEKQKPDDIVGNDFEVEQENLKVTSGEKRKFPVYAMPMKSQRRILN